MRIVLTPAEMAEADQHAIATGTLGTVHGVVGCHERVDASFAGPIVERDDSDVAVTAPIRGSSSSPVTAGVSGRRYLSRSAAIHATSTSPTPSHNMSVT